MSLSMETMMRSSLPFIVARMPMQSSPSRPGRKYASSSSIIHCLMCSRRSGFLVLARLPL
ncbi:Uncharacterised protein [Mycobacterium tuberculosis]|nr:Uncharacterised protein [Mycobacterium tuberculosis]